MNGEKVTIIDARTEIEGRLSGQDAHVLGRFQGDVTLAGRLVVGEGARVEAKVRSEAVEIAGDFTGEILARSLLVTEKGRLQGTVAVQKLAIREGALVNASFQAGETARPAPEAAKPPAEPPRAEAGPRAPAPPAPKGGA